MFLACFRESQSVFARDCLFSREILLSSREEKVSSRAAGRILARAAILSRAKYEILRVESTRLSRERNLFSRGQIFSRAGRSMFAREDLCSREVSRFRARSQSFRARFHDFRAKSLQLNLKRLKFLRLKLYFHHLDSLLIVCVLFVVCACRRSSAMWRFDRIFRCTAHCCGALMLPTWRTLRDLGYLHYAGFPL